MPNEWQAVLDGIKNEVSEMAFGSYFTNLKFVNCDGQTLTIAAPNVFSKGTIEKKYRPIIIEAANNTGMACSDLAVTIQEDSANKRSTVVKRAFEIRPDNAPRVITSSIAPTKANTPSSNISTYGGTKRFSTADDGLNPKYRLDNYVIGSNNDAAVSAARAIIENPGTRINPLFVYGGPGVGKTHLVQAIGNEIKERYPQMTVRFATTEQFYHEFVEAMHKKIDGFTDKYRHVDVLIIDDFQGIIGKEKSQDEFFHTFNELHQHDKQIIITSDRRPDEIATLDKRLSTRLMMGIAIDIQMPDFETRCAIIKTKVDMFYNQEIDDASVEQIAGMQSGSVRELDGTLNRVMLLAEMRNKTPAEILKEYFSTPSQLISTHARTSIQPRKLVEKVAKYYGLTPDDLYGKCRVKNINTARQICMYLMNEELKMSTVKIGAELEKDHTTIMNGLKKIKASIKDDFGLREQISELREQIYA